MKNVELYISSELFGMREEIYHPLEKMKGFDLAKTETTSNTTFWTIFML